MIPDPSGYRLSRLSGLSEHTRTARLPHGFRVSFKYAADVGLTAEWTPDTPNATNIKSKRAQRKFIEAYKAARDDFMRDIATLLGGPVIIADVGGNLGGVTVIEPEAVH